MVIYNDSLTLLLADHVDQLCQALFLIVETRSNVLNDLKLIAIDFTISGHYILLSLEVFFLMARRNPAIADGQQLLRLRCLHISLQNFI